MIRDHGNDENTVDKINAHDTRYQTEKICMINILKVDNNELRIKTYLIVDHSSYSLVEEYKRLHENKERLTVFRSIPN